MGPGSLVPRQRPLSVANLTSESRLMRFRLRTLLIVLALRPPLIAFPLSGLALAIVAALPGFLLFLIYVPAILDP